MRQKMRREHPVDPAGAAVVTRATHTYAVLDVAQATFDDIHARLELAGYQHAFLHDGAVVIRIDMTGIALAVEPQATDPEDDGDTPFGLLPRENLHTLLTWAFMALIGFVLGWLWVLNR